MNRNKVRSNTNRKMDLKKKMTAGLAVGMAGLMGTTPVFAAEPADKKVSKDETVYVIISSGFSFFAATFGVALYSKVDMIGSICTLLARGALISMFVVILILPAMFMIFDKVICKTSAGFLGKKTAERSN